MFRQIFWLFLLTFSVSTLAVSPTLAASPQQVGKFGDWTAYVLMENGE